MDRFIEIPSVFQVIPTNVENDVKCTNEIKNLFCEHRS